jgi:transposase
VRLIDSGTVFQAIFPTECALLCLVTDPCEQRADGLPSELPSDLAGAHAMILAQREMLAFAQNEAKVRALEIERLKLLLAKARHERFGQSSERGKLLVEQLELAIEDLEESQAEEEARVEITAPETAKAQRRRQPRGPRKLPDDLPVERVVEPAPCTCGKCGGSRLRKLGEVVSKTLECEPRRWKIVEHVREKFACRDCEAITEPPAPSHPIPRGFAGPSLLAMILVGKFGDHLPLNRQSAAFAREGVEIDTSTLADWVGACVVALDPIVSRLREHVLAAERLHVDDTTVPVLAKTKTRTGRLWTYVRDDRPFGGHGPPAAFYDYSPSRHGEYPRKVLTAWSGVMQADAFSGYNALYAEGRKPGPIFEAACWAHGRRDFFDLAKLTKAPIASEIVRRIDELFAVERDINGKPPDERQDQRQERSKPLVVALEAYLREQRERLSPKNNLAKAIHYMLVRWASFTRFLDDGRICLSNNAAERALRGVALGRRNWTFAGSDEGGRRAAAVYSLITTCKLNDVDPHAWLAYVLATLPDHPITRVNELMPWAWKASLEAAAQTATAAAA